MGKTLPKPYPGQSIDDYREQLVNFQNNYWSFLKTSKGGRKFIPLPPEHLKPKEVRPNIIPVIVVSNKKRNETKKMSRKLNESIEEELFNIEKRVTVDPEKVIKTIPKIVKESVLGVVEDKPIKKKKPYYRNKYNKPKPVEITPEPVNQNLFVKGIVLGIVITIIVGSLIYNLS